MSAPIFSCRVVRWVRRIRPAEARCIRVRSRQSTRASRWRDRRSFFPVRVIKSRRWPGARIDLAAGLNALRGCGLHALWIREFFRLPDCGLGAWRVGFCRIGHRREVLRRLPDFARDAVIRSFKHLGEFAFGIRGRKTGNPLFELKAAGSNSRLLGGRVPVADSYPGEQVSRRRIAKVGNVTAGRPEVSLVACFGRQRGTRLSSAACQASRRASSSLRV